MVVIKPFKILVINPNTDTMMTSALREPIKALIYDHTELKFHTNPDPSGPRSINDMADAEKSTTTILPSLEKILHLHEGFIVACFSPHPLVQRLREMVAASSLPLRPVTGIFEAAVAAAQEYTPINTQWAIVTTAEAWREPISKAVGNFLSHASDVEWDYRKKSSYERKFGGVETTGLTAGELHDAPFDLIDKRMAEALGHLVDVWEGRDRRVSVVVLGCAGMVGWNDKVQQEMKKRFGDGPKAHVLVIDPVLAGVCSIQSALRMAG